MPHLAACAGAPNACLHAVLVYIQTSTAPQNHLHRSSFGDPRRGCRPSGAVCPACLTFSYSLGYAATSRTDCSAGYNGATDPRPSPTPIAYPIFMVAAGAMRHVRLRLLFVTSG